MTQKPNPEAQRILSEIGDEPVENGRNHPGTGHLRLLFAVSPAKTITSLEMLVGHDPDGGRIASILRCFGQLELGVLKEWGFSLIRRALQHGDVHVRDTAIQVLENWGTEKAIALLKENQEREKVPWLQDYATRVINDIKEQNDGSKTES